MCKLLGRWRWILIVTAAMSASGCGNKQTFPVKGIVVFKDGTPLTGGGLVMFELIGDGPAKVCARGDIQPDGTFHLGTFKRDDGAHPGRYRVTVSTLPGGGEAGLGKPVIHPRYEKMESSELEFTVEPKSNQIRIEVDRP